MLFEVEDSIIIYYKKKKKKEKEKILSCSKSAKMGILIMTLSKSANWLMTCSKLAKWLVDLGLRLVGPNNYLSVAC